MLKRLKTYADSNRLTLNVNKTKVTIFNKNGRHIRKTFMFGNNKIRITRQFKHLGFRITTSREITSGLNDIKVRVTRAFIKIKTKMGMLFQEYPLVSVKPL